MGNVTQNVRGPAPADRSRNREAELGEPLTLSPADLARELGVSTRTIRRLDLEGRLPAPLHIGRAVRWRRDDIVRWIAAGAPRRDEWEANAQERGAAR